MWIAMGFSIVWSFLVAWRYRTATRELRFEYSLLSVARLKYPAYTGQCDVPRMKSLSFWMRAVFIFHAVFNLVYMTGFLLFFNDAASMEHYLIGVAGVALSIGISLGDMTVQLVKTTALWNRMHAGGYSC